MTRLATLTAILALGTGLAGCAADPTDSGDMSEFGEGKADDVTHALCEKIRDGEVEIDEVGEGDVLTKEVWKTIDVIVNFPFDECEDAITQSQIEIDGELYWQFTSHEDSCDGGNTYGSIYTNDLSTPVAHIYDGDIACDGWREEDKAQNHVCDLAAEELAQQKMAEFGLPFVAQSSSIQLRDPYAFDFIFVEGILPEHGDKEATVKVLVNLENNCSFGSVSIDHLRL